MTLEALGAAVARAEAASLAEAVGLIRPFLQDIGWLTELLKEGCRAMAADPLHLPPYRATRSGGVRHLVLVRTERVWMTATVVDPAPPSEGNGRVQFSGRVTLCRPLGETMLIGERFVLDGERAVAAGSIYIGSGEVLEMDERHESVRMRIDEAPLVLLRAQVAPPGPARSLACNGITGEPVANAEVDEGHARSLMLLSLLRLQGRRDASGVFVAALSAALPSQRWAVMREYLALDTRAALPALAAMADNDIDAEVRRLARRTLAQVRGARCLA